MNKVNVISLGCSKNLVDSELLLKQLAHAGYRTETDAENSDAEVVVINTCGFIGDAKEESVNTILEQVERKKAGIVKRLLVMGCLSQRYGNELRKEIPEADAFSVNSTGREYWRIWGSIMRIPSGISGN